MDTDKKNAKIVGVLFILAFAAGVLGLLLYDPIINGSGYLSEGSLHTNQVLLGALFELITVVAIVGTATTMFPILRRHNETVALWHLCFRFLEAIVITVGIISVLALLTLSREYVSAGSLDSKAFRVSGTLLIAIKDWTFMMGPLFFLGINTMMYSYIFYKSRLVPRFLSILGITSSILVFSNGILVMFGVVDQISIWGLMALPIAANEMILAVWLIVKGFNRVDTRPIQPIILFRKPMEAG